MTDTLRKEDVWVLNSQTPEQKSADLTKTIRQLYMQDFISAWDELLGDIQLANIGNLTQRISSARLLSGNPSPMRNLLVNVSKNVTLRDEKSDADSRSLLAKTEDRLNQNANRTLEALFTNRPANADGDVSAQPEQLVMAHFAPLLELAQSQGEGNKAIPFDSVLKQVDELYSYLTAVQGAANSGMSAPPSDIIPRLQAESGRLPVPFKQMLLSLAIGASSDTQRKEMENVKKRISFEVGSFCRQAIAGRYPLVARARQEVTPDDLARMFAPNSGLMDSFFRDNLQGKVDTTRANWRFTPGVDGKTLPGGEGILRSFQQAQRIRDAFFANGTATPSYRVTVRPVRMDNDILNLTLDIDGQLFKYSHAAGTAGGQLAGHPQYQPGASAAGAGQRHHRQPGDQRAVGAEPPGGYGAVFGHRRPRPSGDVQSRRPPRHAGVHAQQHSQSVPTAGLLVPVAPKGHDHEH